MTESHDPSPGRNPRAVLLFGVGAVVVLAALFGAIAEDVATGDPLVKRDQAIAASLHAHGHPIVVAFLMKLTQLHSVAGVSVLALAFGAYLAWRRAWYWLLTLALALPGGMVMNTLLKQAFQRARPTFDDPLLTLTSYSFPSGHTAGATLFYGVLAAYLLTQVRTPLLRAGCVTGAVLMVALVGFSRMYLGAHYLSDVLAAAAASACWLVLCLLLVHLVDKRREA
jgi:undecaprenyl-diphosphatase